MKGAGQGDTRVGCCSAGHGLAAKCSVDQGDSGLNSGGQGLAAAVHELTDVTKGLMAGKKTTTNARFVKRAAMNACNP